MRYVSLFVLAMSLALYGCSPTWSIKDAPTDGVKISAVSDNVKSYRGNRVRWGGTILSVENINGETWIEILERKLDSHGVPMPRSPSGGRFLVRATGFLDPEIYAKGEKITVVGTLAGGKEKAINKSKYQYPVVVSYEHRLWQEGYGIYRHDRRFGGPSPGYGRARQVHLPNGKTYYLHDSF